MFRKLIKKYREQSLKPAFIYGPNDHSDHLDFDAQSGHIDNGQ